MIKKLVLLVLVLILIPLTYLLYRQMEALEPAKDMPVVQKAEELEQDLDPQRIMRQWTPPQAPVQGPVTQPDASETTPAAQQAETQQAETQQQDAPPAKDNFTAKEMLAPQREVTELMSAIQARSLQHETSPTLDLPQEEPQQAQSAFPPPQALPKGVNTLKELHVVAQNNAVLVQVASLGNIASYKYFFVGSPSRLVLDLLGKYDRFVPEQDVRDNVFIKDIRTGRHPDKLRIVADLKSSARLRVSVEKPQPNVLVLHLTKQ